MAVSPESAALIGRRVGGCELLEVIGQGGMGTVYLANQLALNKKVALKILDDRWAKQERYVESFLREARLAAKLEDENIVAIYDVGTDGPHHYIVMQLARGESLHARLKRGPLEIEEALACIEGVARGLAVAHRSSITHRDIKPPNIILGEDGGIKILDFGLAKLQQETADDKSQGQFMGSVAFMAPEQSEYMPIDVRSDIYALGVTAWQCLAGQLPFRGADTWELLVRHHCEEAPAPSLLRKEVPLTVSRVVLKMMAKAPEDRYQTADDLLTDLKLLRRHQLPGAAAPWKLRPLNPDPVDTSAFKAEKLYKEALAVQREDFRASRLVRPLRELLPGLGVVYRAAAGPNLLPANFLELVGKRPDGGPQTTPLAFAATHDFAPPGAGGPLRYAGRFEVSRESGRVVVRMADGNPLGLADVQRLFDLLEVLPADVGHVAVVLHRHYTAQGKDIRWVVDAYNLLDRRGTAFSLVVGSMDNHSTFVNLGIDGHVRLELELERNGEAEEPRKPAEAADHEAEETAAGAPELSPSAAALVGQIRDRLHGGELAEAVRAWRRLVAEGLDKRQMAGLSGLRGELYDRLLAEGKEAFEQDDAETSGDRFNLLIDLDPGRYEGHYYKGLLLKAEGKLEYAQAFLTQAILSAPDEADVFYHRAIVRSRVNDLEGALRDLDMALTHNPRLASAYYNRSKLHRSIGRIDLARRDMMLFERLKGEKAGKSGRAKQTAPPATAEPEA